MASAEPSGLRIETFALQQAFVPMLTAESFRLTRCPAVPANARRASSPDAVVVTVTGAPPAEIDLGTVPIAVRTSDEPPASPLTVIESGPSLLGVY